MLIVRVGARLFVFLALLFFYCSFLANPSAKILGTTGIRIHSVRNMLHVWKSKYLRIQKEYGEHSVKACVKRKSKL